MGQSKGEGPNYDSKAYVNLVHDLIVDNRCNIWNHGHHVFIKVDCKNINTFFIRCAVIIKKFSTLKIHSSTKV